MADRNLGPKAAAAPPLAAPAPKSPAVTPAWLKALQEENLQLITPQEREKLRVVMNKIQRDKLDKALETEITKTYRANLATVNNLLKQGANLDLEIDYNGDSPPTSILHYAHFNQSVAIVKTLLANGAKRDTNGLTDLHWAAYFGDEKEIAKHLAQDVDVDVKAIRGFTPLMSAALNGQIGSIETLVSQGAIINQTNNKGATPLMWAALNGHLQTVQWLAKNNAVLDKENEDGITSLMAAAYGGHVKTVEWLAENGVAVDKENNKEETPLMLAASNGHVKTVQWLYANGAAVDKKNKYGSTPLMLAASNGHVKTVQWLYANGAAVDKENNNGWTPLMWAAFNGHVKTVQWLAENGVAVDKENNKEETPLMLAAFCCHLETVQWLDKNGAKITPPVLEYATKNEKDDLKLFAYLIIESETDLGSETGDKLRKIAEDAGNTDIYDYIVQEQQGLRALSSLVSEATRARKRQETILLQNLDLAEDDADLLQAYIEIAFFRIAERDELTAQTEYCAPAREIAGRNQGKLADANKLINLQRGLIENLKAGKLKDTNEKAAKKYYNNALKYFKGSDQDNPLTLIGTAAAYAATGRLSEAVDFQSKIKVDAIQDPEWQRIYESNNVVVNKYKSEAKAKKQDFASMRLFMEEKFAEAKEERAQHAQASAAAHAQTHATQSQIKTSLAELNDNFRTASKAFSDLMKQRSSDAEEVDAQLENLVSWELSIHERLRALPQRNAEQEQQLASLEEGMQALRISTQPIVAQHAQEESTRQEIATITAAPNPNIQEYYNHLQTTLNNIFVGASAIAGSAASGESNVGYGLKVLSVVLNLGGVFTAPISAGVEAAKQIDNQYGRKEAFDFAIEFGKQMGGRVSKFEELSEQLARKLVLDPEKKQKIETLSAEQYARSGSRWKRAKHFLSWAKKYDPINNDVQKEAATDAARLVAKMKKLNTQDVETLVASITGQEMQIEAGAAAATTPVEERQLWQESLASTTQTQGHGRAEATSRGRRTAGRGRGSGQFTKESFL